MVIESKLRYLEAGGIVREKIGPLVGLPPQISTLRRPDTHLHPSIDPQGDHSFGLA